MIATGQFMDMLERLEHKAIGERKAVNEGCHCLTAKREWNRYYDGYGMALKEMFVELEKEI